MIQPLIRDEPTTKRVRDKDETNTDPASQLEIDESEDMAIE
jgi:hypothetical protein